MMLSMLISFLLTGAAFATPLGTKVADVPYSATDSVATFTWTDASETTIATIAFPQRRAIPTWPRHFHQPLDINHLGKAAPTPIHVGGIEENIHIVNPKHQVERPIETAAHHKPISESGPHSFEHEDHATWYTEKSISLAHVEPTLHERQAETTFTFTGASTTQIFTFTSPTGTGAFSSFTFTGTDFPFQKDRRAESTVTATWDGSTSTFTFTDPTVLPFTAGDLDKRATTTAPTPSAFPINTPDTCADACDAADVQCSSLMTTYTGNSLCSSWFKSCHSFCSAATATALPTL